MQGATWDSSSHHPWSPAHAVFPQVKAYVTTLDDSREPTLPRLQDATCERTPGQIVDTGAELDDLSVDPDAAAVDQSACFGGRWRKARRLHHRRKVRGIGGLDAHLGHIV